MTAPDYVAVIVGICSITAFVFGGVKWLVKHYLAELKPNGGASMHDRLARVEAQIDHIIELLVRK
jgi:hypothetical protein